MNPTTNDKPGPDQGQHLPELDDDLLLDDESAENIRAGFSIREE